jgi:hypothetical protein
MGQGGQVLRSQAVLIYFAVCRETHGLSCLDPKATLTEHASLFRGLGKTVSTGFDTRIRVMEAVRAIIRTNRIWTIGAQTPNADHHSLRAWARRWYAMPRAAVTAKAAAPSNMVSRTLSSDVTSRVTCEACCVMDAKEYISETIDNPEAVPKAIRPSLDGISLLQQAGRSILHQAAFRKLWPVTKCQA